MAQLNERCVSTDSRLAIVRLPFSMISLLALLCMYIVCSMIIAWKEGGQESGIEAIDQW